MREGRRERRGSWGSPWTAVYGEAEWRFGVAVHGGVLAGEWVSGDVGKLRELRGGEREVRCARACTRGNKGEKRASGGAPAFL
jgi:hypothetical protein